MKKITMTDPPMTERSFVLLNRGRLGHFVVVSYFYTSKSLHDILVIFVSNLNVNLPYLSMF